MAALPMTMNDVPGKAPKARKTKKEARLGATAVAMLNVKNNNALAMQI